MRIEIRKTASGSYIVQLGEAMARLEEPDMKALAVAAAKALGGAGAAADGGMSDLVARLAAADDVGVQILLGKAKHDDIVALLKAAESHDATLKKLYGNMSPNNRKVCVEDLTFRFKSPPPASVFRDAAARLNRQIKLIEAEGVRMFR
jgi:hypothetical protein